MEPVSPRGRALGTWNAQKRVSGLPLGASEGRRTSAQQVPGGGHG